MSKIKITRRHLPHWTAENVAYFITFRAKEIDFDAEEQVIILEHIKKGNNRFYVLHSAIVMPDHVHLILELKTDFTLSRVMKGIKGVSANIINIHRSTKGQVWQDESFDRIIRDEKEYHKKLTYMFNNPIKAGLTEDTFSYHGWFFNEDIN